MAATSCTRRTSAPFAAARTLEAIVPPSRSSASAPVSFPMKLLRELPSTMGRPSSGQLAESPGRLEVVLDGLAEADARVDPDPVLGDAGRDGGLDPAARKARDFVDDVVVARVVLHGARGRRACA